MFAHLVQGGTQPAMRDEMNRAVNELLIPALKAEEGFRGAVNLEDRVTGHGIMLTFWDTEDQAKHMSTSAGFKAALGEIMRVSTGERAPMSFWHVNVAEVG